MYKKVIIGFFIFVGIQSGFPILFDQRGYSVFADYKILVWNISIMARFDNFQQKRYGTWYKSERIIGGIAYHLFQGNKIMLDYDHQEGGSFLGDKTSRLELVFEVVF